MLQSIVSWWVAVFSRWCRAYPQTARRHRGSGVGVCVVGCVLVWHGVGWAQQRAVSWRLPCTLAYRSGVR